MRPLLLADAVVIAVVIFARVGWAIVTETGRQNRRRGETLWIARDTGRPMVYRFGGLRPTALELWAGNGHIPPGEIE